MIVIYGSLLLYWCREFWDDLNLVGHMVDGPWMLAWDFNVVLEQKDKRGDKPVSSSRGGGFRGMVDCNGLIDMEYT